MVVVVVVAAEVMADLAEAPETLIQGERKR